eukprot:5662830-Prymnesium_polylepis.1
MVVCAIKPRELTVGADPSCGHEPDSTQLFSVHVVRYRIGMRQLVLREFVLTDRECSLPFRRVPVRWPAQSGSSLRP